MQASDSIRSHVRLFPEALKDEEQNFEDYSFENPMVLVGNLILGEMYIEPQGKVEVVNHCNSERCELEFKAKGWTSKNINSILGVIKDEDGKARYHLTGKYTENFEVVDLESDETWEIWKSPESPPNAHMMYGMGSFALQMNLLNDTLKEKLPPTDSRFRSDVRLWEEAKLEEASDAKHGLEEWQRARKKTLKEEILKDKDLTGDDKLYYKPKYFEMMTHPLTGDDFYILKEKEGQRNYWKDRDNCDWGHMPKIYDEDCEPFY